MTDIIYLTVSISGLAALAVVLALVGRAAGTCPDNRDAARVATLVVTTGFAAIGAGVVLIIAAALPVLATGSATALYVALGISAIALGIGFYSAATTLRDILRDSAEQRRAAVGQGAA